jgi:hypothetical protein
MKKEEAAELVNRLIGYVIGYVISACEFRVAEHVEEVKREIISRLCGEDENKEGTK